MARRTKADGGGGEQGVVSLLTVIFFMIFISLIVIAYMGLVMNDQRQTTDSDLSASALAAARSGVEDGKRILLYCQTTADPHCTSALLNSADNCDLFKTGHPGVDIASTLQIPIDPGTGQGATGGADQYQQYFTCLTIQQDTPYVTATVNEGTSFIQKMDTTKSFNRLTVEWSGTGTFADRTGPINGWPNVSNWNASGYAPVLQLQVIPYKTSDFSDPNGLNNIEHQSSTFYIAPCPTTGLVACGGSALLDIGLDNRGVVAGQVRAGSIPLAYAGCTTTGSGGYDCSVMLKLASGGGNNPTKQYYVRASVLYATTTTLKLAPADGNNGNAPVLFRNVQPWIDVTGRTNDVFRRVRAQVSYKNTAPLPQYVIDSAAPVCKDMTVTADGRTSTYNCSN